MRISRIALLISVIISLSVPAIAFYPSGRINHDISYSNIELIQQTRSLRVTGTLENHTNHPIRFNATIKFVTIHKDVLNSGRIHQTIPPHGSVQFNCHLDKNNFKQTQNSYKLEWQVRDS